MQQPDDLGSQMRDVVERLDKSRGEKSARLKQAQARQSKPVSDPAADTAFIEKLRKRRQDAGRRSAELMASVMRDVERGTQQDQTAHARARPANAGRPASAGTSDMKGGGSSAKDHPRDTSGRPEPSREGSADRESPADVPGRVNQAPERPEAERAAPSVAGLIREAFARPAPTEPEPSEVDLRTGASRRPADRDAASPAPDSPIGAPKETKVAEASSMRPEIAAAIERARARVRSKADPASAQRPAAAERPATADAPPPQQQDAADDQPASSARTASFVAVALTGIVLLFPLAVILGMLAMVTAGIAAFSVLGADRIWTGVADWLAKTGEKNPARAARCSAALGWIAETWDRILDLLPEQWVGGLYMPDLETYRLRAAARRKGGLGRL